MSGPRTMLDEAMAAHARAERHGHSATAAVLAGIGAMIADLEAQGRALAGQATAPDGSGRASAG